MVDFSRMIFRSIFMGGGNCLTAAITRKEQLLIALRKINKIRTKKELASPFCILEIRGKKKEIKFEKKINEVKRSVKYDLTSEAKKLNALSCHFVSKVDKK